MLKIIYHMIEPMPDGYRARIAWRNGEEIGIAVSETVPSQENARELMPKLEELVKQEHPN